MSRTVFNFKRIYILMRKALDERFSAFHLTTSQFEILGYLSHSGSMEQQRLQHCTGITPATLTGLLEKLEGRQYVNRRQSDDDTRAKIVTLTLAGRDVFTQLVEVIDQFEDEMLDKFSRAEQTLLEDWLGRIASNLGDADYGQCD